MLRHILVYFLCHGRGRRLQWHSAVQCVQSQLAAGRCRARSVLYAWLLLPLEEAANVRQMGHQNWGGGRLGSGDEPTAPLQAQKCRYKDAYRCTRRWPQQASSASAPSAPGVGERLGEVASGAGAKIGEARKNGTELVKNVARTCTAYSTAAGSWHLYLSLSLSPSLCLFLCCPVKLAWLDLNQAAQQAASAVGEGLSGVGSWMRSWGASCKLWGFLLNVLRI